MINAVNIPLAYSERSGDIIISSNNTPSGHPGREADRVGSRVSSHNPANVTGTRYFGTVSPHRHSDGTSQTEA